MSHVAVLNDKNAQPIMLVAWDEAHSTMTLHRLGDVQLPPDRAMQLWGIPASGHPVSLGVLPNSGNGKVSAAATTAGKLRGARHLDRTAGRLAESQRPERSGGIQRQAVAGILNSTSYAGAC